MTGDSSRLIVEGPITKLQHLECRTAHELHGYLHPFTEEYVHSQYLDLAADEEIDRFLASGTLYDSELKEWTGLANMKFESDVRGLYTTIVNAIISWFAKASDNTVSRREACTTDYKPFVHVERNGLDLCTSPAMVIRATGPSFETPPSTGESDGNSLLGYTNTASCIQILMEENLCDDDSYYASESSVFAWYGISSPCPRVRLVHVATTRQMFLQQPNRRFVCNLLLTEEVCHLYHFDRSGAQYTPPLNIHENPATFIRLILGVSSHDEAALGLDTSVQWSIQEGRKVSGTITVTDSKGVKSIYQLSDTQPVFRRFSIQGRGTTGWRATDIDGIEVFIKDSWRPEAWIPEYKVLEHMRNVDGAAHMYAFEVAELSTRFFRDKGCNVWSLEGFRERISTRVVLAMLGQSILYFQSQRQLFAAIRDAIAAHRTLINEREVLHRDVSQNNILLGQDGAPVGQRGVLIDFDMAVHGKRPLGQAASDFKAGTLLFMSLSVLCSHRPDTACAPNHDQLDDLESFYCMLYDMMCSFQGVGNVVAERPREIRIWDEDPNPMVCITMKKAHYFDPQSPDVNLIPKFWLPASINCLVEFYKIIRPIIFQKLPLHPLDSSSKRKALRRLIRGADATYDQILNVFDKALLDLEVQEVSQDDRDTLVDILMDDIHVPSPHHTAVSASLPFNPTPTTPSSSAVAGTPRDPSELPTTPMSHKPPSNRKRKAPSHDGDHPLPVKRSRQIKPIPTSL